MVRFLALVAAMFLAGTFSPCLSQAQSREEGMRLFRDANALIDSAATPQDLKNAQRTYEQALRIFEQIGSDQGKAAVTHKLGFVYYRLQQHGKAAECWEKSLTISRKIGAAAIEADSQYNLGQLLYQRAQSKEELERCLQMSDGALRIFERLRNDRAIASASLAVAATYDRLSQTDKAVEFYEKSLKVKRRMHDEGGAARVMNNLADVYSKRGQFSKAVDLSEKALAIHRRLAYKADEVHDLLQLGSAWSTINHYPKATEYFNQALDAARKLKDQKLEANALKNLANICLETGQLDEAAHLLTNASEIYRNLGDIAGNADVADLLGHLHQTRGQYDKASEYYEKELVLSRKLGSVSGQALALANLGRVYRDIGEYDKAKNCYTRSRDLARQVGLARLEGSELIDLGSIHVQKGEYAPALELLQQGLAVWEKSGIPTDWPKFLIGNVYLDVGDADRSKPYVDYISRNTGYYSLPGRYHLMKGEYDEARVDFEKFVKFDEKEKNPTNLFISWTGLGLAYEGKQDYSRAADYFAKAVDQAEELRSSLSEAERSRFFDVKVWGFARTEPYEGLARVLMKLNKPLEALKQSEYSKARIFAEAMSKRSSEASVKVPADVLRKDSQLNEHLASLMKKRQKSYEKGDRQAIDAIELQLKEARNQLQKHIRSLRKDYPLFAATKYPQPMEVEQTAVKPDEWLLAYQVTDTGICIWLLKGKTVIKSLFKPISRKNLNQLVRSFRKPLEMHAITEANLLAFKDAMGNGKELFDLLVSDSLDSIPKGQPLTILPDGMLGILPFEMLVIKEGTGWNTSGQQPYPEGVVYFGDRNPISYYQSLTALTLARTLRQVKKTGSRTLVMADPVFQTDDPRLKEMVKKRKIELLESVSIKLMSIKKETGLVFGRLPLTGELGAALKNLQPDTTDLYMGMDASKSRLFQKNLDMYQAVVFATHGYVGEGLPGIMEPVLVLTLVDQPQNQDGFLRMSEVMSLDLSADVVALTACQTGLGNELKGEGTMGMGRAFQYAGAKSVLMTLWSVSEASTTQMTETFLSYVKQGKTRLEALQLARKEIRADGFEHPFFWAPFILVGEVQ